MLNCARQAAPRGFKVEHGTLPGRKDVLLRSDTDEVEMGRLKPDILILQGDTVTAVIDAKYKRLHNSLPTKGVDQGDLYQLVSYSLRFNPTTFSALVYPLAPDDDVDQKATAEKFDSWHSDERIYHSVESRRKSTPVETRSAR